MVFIEMTNFLRKKRAEWSDFSDELEDSYDSSQTVWGWRNGNTIGKASVSVGKRTFDKNNFRLKQNELAEVQYNDSVYNDISITARNQLPNKRLSHLSKPSDCLNVSDSDMSLAIIHGSSMRTHRTVPNHRGSSYKVSASHSQQTSSSSPYIGHRIRKKRGFETRRDGNTLPGYNTFRNMNGSKDVSHAITEKDVSRLIEAVKTKCLSPARIQLLQKVLDSTAEGSPISKKRYPKMRRPARSSTSKRRTNELYQSKRKSFYAKSDSSDLSSAETDCSDNTINSIRPLHTNNNEMYSTKMTEFKLPSNGLRRTINERTKPLSTYDLRNDAMSNVMSDESNIRGVGPAHSNYLSTIENSFYPNHRSTMLNVDCTNQSSMTNMSMRPSFIRRKLYSQSHEYIEDGNENSSNGRRAAPNIYANTEEGLSKRSSRRSLLSRYSRRRQSSNTDYFQIRGQTSVRQVNVTPVLERLMEKCNTTGLRNKYLPHVQKRNTGESSDIVGVRSPIDRSTGQPLKKKLLLTSDSDQLTDDVASDCNTEVKSCKEPNPQQQEDNGSPKLNLAIQKNTKKPEVIIPCYVYLRKEDIITNTGSFTKTSLGSEKGIQYNKFQSSLTSSPSDGEPAKDDIGVVKNISNFTEHQISTYMARVKAKNFGNVECNTAPLIIDSSETDKPLKKLTSLSTAKPDNSLKNPILSIESSDDDDFILNNGKKKVQSSKSISSKSLSLNNSKERNVSTRRSYFLRPKTVINNLNDDSDLNNEFTHKGQKIKTLDVRLAKKDRNEVNEKVIKGKAFKFGKIQKAAVAQKKQGCTIKNVQTVKKTPQPRHKQNEVDKEKSSTLEVSVQSDSGLRRSSRKRVEPMIYWKSQSFSCRGGNMNSGKNMTCQNTKQLNKSGSPPSCNTKCSKSVANKAKQTSKFWNLSSSGNEDDEFNKERMNSSDKQITHNVPDLEASVGDEVPVKAVHLAIDGATLEMSSLRHNIKTATVEQQLCLNVQENYNSLNILTLQSEQEPITNIKSNGVLRSFLNKSERVVKRNTRADDAENCLIPIIPVDFKHTSNVNNNCNSVIEMNTKPRSGSRYGRLHEGNTFFNEDDGCCTVVSFKTKRTRRRKTRFVHFF